MKKQRRKIGFYQGPRVSTNKEVAKLFKKWGYDVVTITEKDLEQDKLKDFSAIYIPGGHSVILSERGIENLKKFVQQGGGFLGICSGAHFAARIKLLNLKDMLIVRGCGTYNMRIIKKHPVTKGLRIVPVSPEKKAVDPVSHTNIGRVKMYRNNGAYMVVGRNVDALVTYDNDDKYAGLVAGYYGKGKVVLFTCHPEVDIHLKGSLSKFNTDTKKALQLLKNAIDYVSV